MPQISIKAFLSHRYKSADVNLYFFKMFNDVAEVQFEIDEGVFSTNVTRLEKMVRNSDAFIGIYPFPGLPTEANNPYELRNQSKYFRLELDLAIRSQKTAIIFYDKRYGNLIKPPKSIFSYPFDYNEIMSTGGFPSLGSHKRLFESFCEAVQKSKNFEEIKLDDDKNVVSIVVSSDQNGNSGYSANCINSIKESLEVHNYSEVEVIQVPTKLNTKLFRTIENVDFAIVEHNSSVAESGIPAFFHGRFIPMIRLQKMNKKVANDNALTKFLFGDFEVGYQKDMIVWDTEEILIKELSMRLDVINSNVRRINTFSEAEKYFRSATLRKEVVFVSYSGKDADIASNIINSLKEQYQTVFNYRDGESIVPGQPWLEEIFNKLASSAIGINLVSQAYFDSGNCRHEAQQMVANYDSGKLKLFPIKLYVEELKEPPSFFGSTQYMRVADYANVKEMVKKIVALT